MSTIDPGASNEPVPPAKTPSRSGFSTLRDLSRYQWWVFSFAVLAWMADCMDQQMFNLGRPYAMEELTGGWKAYNADIATSLFLVGWALGGIIFGIYGDRLGRVRTLTLTILIYSLFTGLSAASITVWDFWAYRLLTGLGVGGVFSAAVALLAEEMPDKARPYSLGALQVLSAVGNCTAAALFMLLGIMEVSGYLDPLQPLSAWRLLFLIGLVPAILVIFIRSKLHEPEAWVRASQQQHADASARKLGSYRELFGEPKWRKHALLGLMLAFSGVVGLWAIGFYSGDLQKKVFGTSVQADIAREHLTPEEFDKVYTVEKGIDWKQVEAKDPNLVPTMEKDIRGRSIMWSGVTFMVLNVGAFFGMFAFSILTAKTGRRPAFAITLLLAMLSTMAVFGLMSERWHILVMVPIMGFFQLALFGGYAIYFPELFPTRLRSTGIAFCYNVGRFLAATGPLAKGFLNARVFSPDNGFTGIDGVRYAGVAMCSVFLIGLIALPFLPETKDQPLPE